MQDRVRPSTLLVYHTAAFAAKKEGDPKQHEHKVDVPIVAHLWRIRLTVAKPVLPSVVNTQRYCVLQVLGRHGHLVQFNAAGRQIARDHGWALVDFEVMSHWFAEPKVCFFAIACLTVATQRMKHRGRSTS